MIRRFIKHIRYRWHTRGMTPYDRDWAHAQWWLSGLDLELEENRLTHRDDPLSRQENELSIKHRWGKLTDEEYNKKMYELRRDTIQNDWRLDDNQRKDLLIRLNYKNGLMSEYDYQLYLIDRISDSKEQKIAKAKLECEHGMITETERDRRIADARQEPFFTCIGGKTVETNGSLGMILEFDFNDKFVESLRAQGVLGRTEDDVVNNWWADVCRSIAREHDLEKELGIVGTIGPQGINMKNFNEEIQ